MHRIGEALELDLAAVAIADALDGAGEVDEPLAGQDLPGTGLPAQPRGEVQGPAAVAVVDRHRLAGVEPDPDRERGSGAGIVSSSRRAWRPTAARIACRGEAKTASASSPRSSTSVPPAAFVPDATARRSGRQRRSRLVAARAR